MSWSVVSARAIPPRLYQTAEALVDALDDDGLDSLDDIPGPALVLAHWTGEDGLVIPGTRDELLGFYTRLGLALDVTPA